MADNADAAPAPAPAAQPHQTGEPSAAPPPPAAADINDPTTTEQPPIEPDSAPLSDDGDSAYDGASDTGSFTTSLMSEVKNYKYENNRRYHSYREGSYVLPNDEAEQDRQDLLHHVRNLTLGGALFLAPLKDPSRAMDIGTGTGIWAIDFGDEFPGCEVIGTDLSPIQPSWVPPNVHFQVDDAEAPWLFSSPFDYIHTRDLGGSVSNWPRLMNQAFANLKPGGWLELQEFEVTLKSDDDTMKLAPTLCEYIDKLAEASRIFKKEMNIAEKHKQTMIETGFENVTDQIFKVPSSGWPKDPKMKEIGRYNLCSLLMAVESYSLALFTRVLGWSNEETQVFLAGVRKDLKNPKVHSYCNLHIVCGQKPQPA